MPTQFQIESIGLAKTCFPQKFGTPRQAGLAKGCLGKIIFQNQNDITSMLDGLKDFSHIWLVWWFDQNTNKVLKSKVHPPMLDGEKKGLFATRSPHRPNPIGLSVVRLLECTKDYLLVDGIDLVDQTPILDIKPYLPHTDSIKDATATWPLDKNQNRLSVEITSSLEEKIKHFENDIRKEYNHSLNLKEAISNILSLDPRPVVYKEKPYKDDYKIAFYNFDIQFVVENNTAIVKDLLLR
ncbi:MAG: tRNA (N6-threonylcarbamoyladenosine(37)-N6)-methyltransferase TrmO [Bdellovibrionales bacterium]|nr:tRNA (N6-threonylcarbamoyladenosine(37)-N6)-methyltransferase TrmO [Bdellovibrionales bacterium]